VDLFPKVDKNELEVTLPNGQQEIVHFLRGSVKPQSPEGKPRVLVTTHFLLGKEGSESGSHNDAVIEAIRQTIVGVGNPNVHKKTDFVEELKESMNKKIEQFFTTENAATKLELALDNEEKSFKLKQMSPDDATWVDADDKVKVKQMDIGSFVSTASTTAKAHYSVTQTKDKRIRVRIDLPGFNPRSTRMSLISTMATRAQRSSSVPAISPVLWIRGRVYWREQGRLHQHKNRSPSNCRCGSGGRMGTTDALRKSRTISV